MKIIDILNKKANETLEDEFKFCYNNEVFTYDKKSDEIYRGDYIENTKLGQKYRLEKCLNDKVLLFREEIEEYKKREKNK